MKKWMILLAGLLILLMSGCRPAAIELQSKTLDDAPRILVLSAFAPETSALLSRADQKTIYTAANRQFTTARLGGKEVVLAESGVSMVNAAMTTQAAVDHFRISAVVFSGIAGGINPDLKIGDVVIPAEWGQHLESVFARQDGEQWDPGRFGSDFGNYGMMFPQPVDVPRLGSGGTRYETIFWFQADPSMLQAATTAASRVTLEQCWLVINCLTNRPKVIPGGRAVSGPAFVDNAEYREWLYINFQANAVDMETAAAAQTAYVNGIPFIGFRSLSDLAGGSAGRNEMLVFGNLAAENAARVVEEFLMVWNGP